MLICFSFTRSVLVFLREFQGITLKIFKNFSKVNKAFKSKIFAIKTRARKMTRKSQKLENFLIDVNHGCMHTDILDNII